MPDITMCMNNECPRKIECYRYMAQPNAYKQSYAFFKADGCKEFIAIENVVQEVKKAVLLKQGGK